MSVVKTKKTNDYGLPTKIVFDECCQYEYCEISVELSTNRDGENSYKIETTMCSNCKVDKEVCGCTDECIDNDEGDCSCGDSTITIGEKDLENLINMLNKIKKGQ